MYTCKKAMLALLMIAAGAFLVAPTNAAAEETTLCREDVVEEFDECPAEQVASHVHLATATGAKATLLNSISNILCDVLFLGEVIAEGAPLTASGNFTYTNCVNEKPSECTVTEESESSTLKVLKEGHEAGTVTSESEVKIVCSGTSCTYNHEGLAATYKGPLLASLENGEASITEQTLTKTKGLLCPSTAKLDITLEPLEALYVAKEGGTPPPPATALCSKDETPKCKEENQLKSIDYVDKAVEILTSLINVKCEGLASGTVGAPGNPLEIKTELTYSSCSGGCFVTVVSGPGKIFLERAKAEEATATTEGFEIFVKCGTTIKCLLGPAKMTGTALGSLTTKDNGHLTFSKTSMGKGEGATCPEEATLDALYVASTAAYIP